MSLLDFLPGLLLKKKVKSDNDVLSCILLKALTQKSFKVKKRGACFIVNGIFSIKSHIFKKSSPPASLRLGINFEIKHLLFDEMLREKIYVSNPDNDILGAATEAVESFLPLLEVLLKSFAEQESSSLTMNTAWGGATLLWHCFLSPIISKEQTPQEDISHEFYYNMLKNDIMPYLGNKRFYVVKVNVSISDCGHDSGKIIECLLDGETLEGAQETLEFEHLERAEYTCPINRTQYIVLKQSDEAFRTPYAGLKLLEIIPEAVYTMVNNYKAPDLYEQISNIAQNDARLTLELFLFIPEVFFEHTHKNLKHDDNIVLKFAGFRHLLLKKKQFAVYYLITAAVHDYLDKHGINDDLSEFMNSRSSSMSVLNEFYHNGGDISEIDYISSVWQINEDYEPYSICTFPYKHVN